MSDNGQQVPLIEQLRRVPAAARVLEHTPNPLGYDTTSIPVGALCREAADRIAELEGELETAQRERDEIRARSIRRKAELATERKRREEAEMALADAVNGALAFSSHGVVNGILNHFARYEKD